MRCSDARKKLSALLDAEGDAAGREAVARHVDGCPACRAELEALAGADRALELAVGARATPPAGYEDALWARLETRLDESTSDLADVRALAERAIERAVSQSSSTVSSELLSAPAVLGHVVLPTAPPRRRPWPLVLGGFAAIAGGATVLVMMMSRRDAPPAAVVEAPPAAAPAPAPVVAPVVEPIGAPATVPPPPAEPAATPTIAEAKPRKTSPAAPAKEKPADAPRPAGAAAPAPEPPKKVDEIAEEMNKPSRPAEPAPDPVGVEKLSHEQIRAGMASIEASVQGCRPADLGRTVVVLRLRVSADGSVAAAEPTGSNAGTPVGDCVAKKARAARFDRFDGPAMTFKYSFTLEADE